jgi:hypothetical protein
MDSHDGFSMAADVEVSRFSGLPQAAAMAAPHKECGDI